MWATRISPSLVSLLLAWILAFQATVQSIPVSHESGPDFRRADPAAPPSKSAPFIASSSIPPVNSPVTTITTATSKTNKAPAPSPTKKRPQYNFDILNPSPHDVWTSGTIVTLTWVDLDLPLRATFDISLIPVDPDTNPEALNITRRPILRYIPAMERVLDIVVPYDLITKHQLIKEQEGDGEFVDETKEGEEQELLQEEHQGDTAVLRSPPASPSQPLPSNTSKPPKDIRSLARLYITAYEGKTNKVLAQKSVFPIEIRRNHTLDRRTIMAPPPASASLPTVVVNQEQGQKVQQDPIDESTEETLEKKDSQITHLEDHDRERGDGQNLTHGHHEEDNSEHDVKGDDNSMYEGQPKEVSSEDEEFELNGSTPTGQEMGETSDETVDVQSNMDPMESMDHENGLEHGSEEDVGLEDEKMHHDHSHFMDPNHFQNEEDIQVWKDHEDDPGYNPPIKVFEAGTINITRWIDNKTRFFVGAPYVFAWEFPPSGLGLTGGVNVYVEDAFTGKRYDIVAGDLPSEVQFMYLHPTAIMMSASPKRRIYLRARVEMDLFKDGNIHRYTGFSKMFWVERGAL